MTFFVGDLSCVYFQVLLKPIVSQLVIEPPLSLEEHSDIPSVEEVDDLLVVCIGQMAVTAGSDLLWKPLNYEVMFLYMIVSALFTQILFSTFSCYCTHSYEVGLLPMNP